MASAPLPELRGDDERRAHPYCQECRRYCESRGRDWKKTTANCRGVYSAPDFEILAARSGLSVQQVREIYDPVEWARSYVGWTPRWYQDRFLRCTSSRVCLRWGRRSGKTEAVAAKILHRCVTIDGYKATAAAAMKSQAKEIFDRFDKFIRSNRELLDDVSTKQQPYYEISFGNGSRIRVFVAGAGSGSNAAAQIRGQESDDLFLDEMDYIADDASTAILPLLSDPLRHEGEPIRFVVSSTPTGREGRFFDLCHDDAFREMHVPSRFRDDWDEGKEREARSNSKTKAGYDHEYNAEWGAKEDGVFRRNDVIAAMKPYRYFGAAANEEREADWPEMKPWPHWTYVMGVDWNGEGTGTRLVVVGWDPVRSVWIVVHREKVDAADFSLHLGVERIVQVNRIWRPRAVYIDDGFGQFQDEYLRRIGLGAQRAQARGQDYEHADVVFAEHLRTVNFGGAIEYETRPSPDGPVEKRKKRIKNYMVENAQRHFELGDLWFSMQDQELKAELMGYSVKGRDIHNALVYKEDEEAKDHDLDALVLALFGFNQEFDPDFAHAYEDRIALARRPGPAPEAAEADPEPDPFEDPIAYQAWKGRRSGGRGRAAAVETRAIETPAPTMVQMALGVQFNPRGARRGAPSAPGGRNAWRAPASRIRHGL